MATVASIREQVRNNLFSRYPAEHPFVEISPGFTDVATTFAVVNGENYSYGDVIENLENGEQLFVNSIATNTLTVTREYHGTTGAASTAGDRLVVNPRITVQNIDQKVSAVIRDLYTHGVYKVETVSITLDSEAYIYSVELGDLVKPPGVIAVYYRDPSYLTPVPIHFRQVSNVHTAVVAAGEGISIDPGSWNASVATAYALVATRYADATELPVEVEEAVVQGATGKLIGGMIGPMLQDPGHLSNRTVPSGQPSRDARWFQGEYITTVRRLAAELAAVDYGLGTITLNRAQRFRR